MLCAATVAGQTFYYLFASDSESMMNVLLSVFRLGKVNWLGQSSTALPVICAVACVLGIVILLITVIQRKAFSEKAGGGND